MSDIYYTTLRKLRNNDACKDRYNVLKSKTIAKFDDPISLKTILETNGLTDAIWALRACDDVDRDARLFACDCAMHVLKIFEKHHFEDRRPHKSILAARRYAKNPTEGNKKKMTAARDAAWAARNAAWDAAWDAASAACEACEASAACAASAASEASAASAAWAASAASVKEGKYQEKLFVKYFCGGK